MSMNPHLPLIHLFSLLKSYNSKKRKYSINFPPLAIV